VVIDFCALSIRNAVSGWSSIPGNRSFRFTKATRKDFDMALPSPERRTNPRIDINGEMTYRTGGSGETRRGEIENMSAGGALIWIADELPVDSELLIRVVELDGDATTLEFRATLLHRLPERKDRLYGYGCSIEVA
jgi:hypothetical protein